MAEKIERARMLWNRRESVAGLGVALLALALLPASAQAQQSATHTSLAVETSDQSGRTQATATVAVTSADGLPASGAIIIEDGDRELAEATLNADGEATPVLPLAGGDHALRAVYAGDATHLTSASATSNVSGQTSATPNFTLSLAPVPPSTLPLKLTAGQAGTIAVTVIPEDNAALTAPMFVNLSCSVPSQRGQLRLYSGDGGDSAHHARELSRRFARIGLPAGQLHAASNAGAGDDPGGACSPYRNRKYTRRLGHPATRHNRARWIGVGRAQAALVAAPCAGGAGGPGNRAGNDRVQAALQLLPARSRASSTAPRQARIPSPSLDSRPTASPPSPTTPRWCSPYSKSRTLPA